MRRLFGIALLVVSLTSALHAQAPAGNEFQVNSYTAGNQRYPTLAAATNGDFVVVWASEGSAGSDRDATSIQGRLFSSDGAPRGANFQINTYTDSIQNLPSIAMAPAGQFVVVWESFGSAGSDYDYLSIQGQRFASDGTPAGIQFQINTITTSYQEIPAVGMGEDGSFVVAWQDYDAYSNNFNYRIRGQRFASDGMAQGEEFQINSFDRDVQSLPSLAVEPDGDFVVVWSSYGSRGNDNQYLSIQGQRFASNGNPQGAQFQVNSYTTDYQWTPHVAAGPNGFVVVWESFGSNTSDRDSWSIRGQRYAPNGTRQGGEFQVNTYTPKAQRRPAVSLTDEGFVVAWSSGASGSEGPDGSSYSVQARIFETDGAPRGNEFRVNTFTGDSQSSPAIARVPDNGFVVAWESAGSAGSDGSGYSIQGQRFAAGPPPPPPGPCTPSSQELCLNGSRFEIAVDWRDFNGNAGVAQVVQLGSPDSGLFWFFTADNWEMLVKVLNGCGVNDHFWVFAAATTNVEYTLRVTDKITEATKSYFNPLGTAAAAITDTEALAVCDASPMTVPGSEERLIGLETEPVRLATALPAAVDDGLDAGTTGGGCMPSESSACLNRGRFQVEIDWRDFNDNVGVARIVEPRPGEATSPDSGLFWFFTADNWEMLVKVLNGCGVNDRFWVFAAATTNVGYTLRVTDTETGVVQEYVNRLGAAANAITDTEAFATCP